MLWTCKSRCIRSILYSLLFLDYSCRGLLHWDGLLGVPDLQRAKKVVELHDEIDHSLPKCNFYVEFGWPLFVLSRWVLHYGVDIVYGDSPTPHFLFSLLLFYGQSCEPFKKLRNLAVFPQNLARYHDRLGPIFDNYEFPRLLLKMVWLS